MGRGQAKWEMSHLIRIAYYYCLLFTHIHNSHCTDYIRNKMIRFTKPHASSLLLKLTGRHHHQNHKALSKQTQTPRQVQSIQVLIKMWTVNNLKLCYSFTWMRTNEWIMDGWMNETKWRRDFGFWILDYGLWRSSCRMCDCDSSHIKIRIKVKIQFKSRIQI